MDPWPEDLPEEDKEVIFDIAVDEDFEIVDVKEEDLDNISETLVDPKLEGTPIVYTTRLDDMLILNQRTVKMAVEDITNRIIKESTPKYTSLSKQVDSARKRSSFTSIKRRLSTIYRKRVEKENVTKAKSSVTEKSILPEPETLSITQRNEKLLKMCKPLRIIIRKYPYVYKTYPQLSPVIHSVESSSESEDEFPLSSLKPTATSQKKKVTKLPKRFNLQPSIISTYSSVKKTFDERKNNFNGSVIMMNQYCNETDIYLVENGNVLLCNTYYGLSKMKPDDKTIVLKFCCWQKRDDFITCSRGTLFNDDTKFVVRKPHNCLNTSNCRCCCRSIKIAGKNKALNQPVLVRSDAAKKQPNPSEDIETNGNSALLGAPEIKQYGYDLDWRQDLLSTANDDNQFVDRACLYTRPLKHSDNNKKSNAETGLPILLRYKTPIKGIECYQIDTNRNITTYVSGLNLNEGSGIVNDLCCWFKRNDLSQNKDTLHSLSKILKSEHECPPGGCKCCCKDVLKVSGTKANTNKLTVVMLTRRLKNAKFNRKKMKTTASRNQQTKSNLQIDTAPLKIRSANQSKSATLQTQNDRVKQPIISIVNPQKKQPRKTLQVSRAPPCNIPVQNNNTSSKYTTSEVTPSSQVFPSVMTNNVAMNKDSLNNTTDTSILSVDSMISTILDRFKDVRLTINPDGKIAAELHTPVSTLSTAELKVLANILAHAQEQVKALGLAPGSSLNFTKTLGTTVDKEVETTTPTVCESPLQRLSQDFTQTAERTSDNFVSEFHSFVNNSINARLGVPKITNVFSLKDVIENVEEDKRNGPSSGSSWYKKPEESDEGSSDIIDMPKCDYIKPDTVTQTKRKSKESEPAPAPQKIRVVDPSKLGISESSSDALITGLNSASLINSQQKVMYVNSLQDNSNLGFVINPNHINQTPPLVKFGGNPVQNLKFLQTTIIPGSSNEQNPLIINNELQNVSTIQVVASMQSAGLPVQSSIFHIADPKIAASTNRMKLVPVSKTDPPRLSQWPQPRQSFIPKNIKIAPALPKRVTVVSNPPTQSTNPKAIIEETLINDSTVVPENIINLDDDS